jgi:outer membrane murein-binding lipoprotein Lpp
MTYSSSLSMSRQQRLSGMSSQYTTRGQNAVDFRNRSRKLGPISNTVTLIVLACLLGLLYLTQVTKTNAYGYQIDTLTQTQAKLKSDHDSLAVESARLQSLDKARASAEATAMAPVTPSGTVQN